MSDPVEPKVACGALAGQPDRVDVLVTPKAAHAGLRHPRTSSRGAHCPGNGPRSMLAAGRPSQSRELRFLIWIAGNLLKGPESDEGIQDDPSPFSWSGLVWIWFGLEELA